MPTQAINHEEERKSDVNRILASEHPKKVVVAGPGTGKSFLFQEAIKKKRKEGKDNFLAITFIGKLGDSLADDLAGLAETQTLHGFARKFVLKHCPDGWEYYPDMFNIIKEDLAIKGITEFVIGDDNYKERTTHYKAVGHDDVVHYAVETCKKDQNKIPKFDLVLIDEFQDFNEVESELIDLLSGKNEVLIVGDDDQALYEFKGSSPKYIRDKFHVDNNSFESHTLRFCSRCTEVIIKAFHGIVEHFGFNGDANNRIKKEYICYVPEKKKDSDANPKIVVMEQAKLGMIPFRIKFEIAKILKTQKIKSVLIIGEGQTCQKLLHTIARKFRAFGFRNVEHAQSVDKPFSINQVNVDGLRILSGEKNDTLAWRLLISQMGDTFDWKSIILANYDDATAFISAIPEDFKRKHGLNSKVLLKILEKPASEIKQIAESSIEKLKKEIVIKKREDRDILIDQLITDNKSIGRPMANLDVTVCSILGSKGLGADVVFLVGFDQGKLPSKSNVADSEIYQILVALTRAKKRIYLINTVDCSMSKFLDCIGSELIERI